MAGSFYKMLSVMSLLLLPSMVAGQYGSEQLPLKDDINYEEVCPDYTRYSAYPQSVAHPSSHSQTKLQLTLSS